MIRGVRPGDGEGCARAWPDAGRHYAATDPEVVRIPDADGLAEWFEEAVREPCTADTRWLVAEEDGVPAGMIEARIV
ncbi:hypothetical protein [Actinomadura sp. DC4]|uniref:hypothetical protein n=1 Tax=Actinomadura sp. DC4 TaxID=3055069 RepID=UPI0025B0ED2B|nr:hypothetical protein [Actinomadura sp. DC4]MDN3356772.1 hypothetical protein [Actinomadura sp. DC4]